MRLVSVCIVFAIFYWHNSSHAHAPPYLPNHSIDRVPGLREQMAGMTAVEQLLGQCLRQQGLVAGTQPFNDAYNLWWSVTMPRETYTIEADFFREKWPELIARAYEAALGTAFGPVINPRIVKEVFKACVTNPQRA